MPDHNPQDDIPEVLEDPNSPDVEVDQTPTPDVDDLEPEDEGEDTPSRDDSDEEDPS